MTTQRGVGDRSPYATPGDVERTEMLTNRAHLVDAAVHGAAVDVGLILASDGTVTGAVRAMLNQASRYGTDSPEAARVVEDFLGTPYGGVVANIVMKPLVLLGETDQYVAAATAAVLARYAEREGIEPVGGRLPTSSIAWSTACTLKIRFRGAQDAAAAECALPTDLTLGARQRPASSMEQTNTGTSGRRATT